MNIKSEISFPFILICIIFFTVACKKDNSHTCTCQPVFKTEDSIIVVPENADNTTIELIICDYNIEYYYTLDGEDPDKNSSLYQPDSGIVLGLGMYQIKVKGYLNSEESEIVTKQYIITKIPLAELENFDNHTDFNNSVTLKLKHADSRITYETTLNNEIIDISKPYTVHEAGFYYLEIISNLDTLSRKDNYEFVILNEERGEAEWGLKTWTPRSFIESYFKDEEIRLIYPKAYVKNLNMPFILKVMENNELTPVYFKYTNSVDNSVSNIKRGIGSIMLLPDQATNSVDFYIKDRIIDIPVELEDPVWSSLDAVIDSSVQIVDGSRIYINKDLSIPEGASLQIGAGSILAIGEGVNIRNNGTLTINGTDENPVIFTCIDNDSYWGGIISVNSASEVIVKNAIFCRSGYHNTGAYIYGHAKRQALFYLDNSRLSLNNSYIIDNIGQIFYPTNSQLYIDGVFIQRAKSGGQINHSYISIEHSLFMDFPDDSDSYIDEDNDALYLNASDADIANSTFMYAKDDGIDSGADLGGIINVNNCWFEATFHEGMALSSDNDVTKRHHITNCTFTNCGQGLELGFSSPNHLVIVDSCYFYSNNIGIRYGDNYLRQVEGMLNVKNSASLNNGDKDIWNMVHRIWQPHVEKMSFVNTRVSKAVDEYPDLIIVE